ncbi:phosphotransferase [Kitasatospora sp. RG8]|uniref:phosphotransferase n=1 Tax=Kitasatospora sp. RG8 TaxID=2820815 RepID=UPI001ADF2799|nr:phosphotransferase [Kitasatospora sp. RG8]MBP0455426.1 phosphotransferase [Kitasatospora sp. RG8]
MGVTTGVTQGQLAALARAAYGAGRRLDGVERLRGGSKKGVYRLAFDDGGTAVAYVWGDAENYWPGAVADDADPLAHASGLDLFEAAHRRLTAVGVRTPRLHLADRSGDHVPADAAVVEDVPGENLETLLDRDPSAAQPVLARLGHTLDVLRRSGGTAAYGKLALLDNGGTSHGRSCEQLVHDRALADLAEAARRDARIAAARDRLAALLHTRYAAVRPRTRYGLVHGELGPDHVLLDTAGEPVLIDIEGLMHFDPEWEHAFLRIRFGSHYHHLHTEDLDRHRLALYALAMRLSLVAGPLRLLDGDFPHRDAMRAIAEYNLGEALALVAEGRPQQ